MALDVTPPATVSLRNNASQLSKALRDAAADAGWPAEYASKLSVTIDGPGITVSYPQSLVQQIEDLEYGTGNISPNPVIRTFIEKYKTNFSNIITTSSVDFLFNTGVLP